MNRFWENRRSFLEQDKNNGGVYMITPILEDIEEFV